jgi:hypothetical protein
MENMNQTNNGATNKLINGIAWGAFFVALGISWTASLAYTIDFVAYLAVGAGIILVAINTARVGMKTTISTFSLFIGALFLALGIPGVLGYAMPFIPTVMLLAGLFIIVQGAKKLSTRAKTQA